MDDFNELDTLDLGIDNDDALEAAMLEEMEKEGSRKSPGQGNGCLGLTVFFFITINFLVFLSL